MPEPNLRLISLRASDHKAYRQGTDRIVAPAETVAQVRRFMPEMGITRIANVTGLDHIGIPVVMVCRPNARSLSVSQGKGLDLASARASGLMEAIELYHAERIELPLKFGSYAELRERHSLSDIADLPQTKRSHIHAHLPMQWIEGYDIMQEGPCWVPFEVVHTNYTMLMHRSMAGFVATSNGLASGNHVLEAISHGICEIVERDATALWRLGGQQQRANTRIDPATINDPLCRSALGLYEQAGVAVMIWETTSDSNIPAFLCRIFDLHETPLRRLGPMEGMGCHPVRSIALLRALTEAAQGRLTLIAGSRDDCYPTRYPQHRDPDQAERLRAELHTDQPMRPFAAGPDWRSESLYDDVVWELERLRSIGIEHVIVIDLTRTAFGIPVVRVIIPGLEAIDERQQNRLGKRAQAHLKVGV